jgi:competence protein ComEC
MLNLSRFPLVCSFFQHSIHHINNSCNLAAEPYYRNMLWSQRPFVRIVLFYIAGILALSYTPGLAGVSINYILSGFILALAGYAFVVFKVKRKALDWLKGLLFGFTFFFLGILISSTTGQSSSTTDIAPGFYAAKFVNDPELRPNFVKAEAQLLLHDTLDGNDQAAPLILIYFQRLPESDSLRYGDVIAFRGAVERVAGPLNPDEFDYQAYLLRKNITHNMYLGEGSWQYVSHEASNIWMAYAYEVRRQLTNKLLAAGLYHEEFAVAAAILLGNDDYMETGLRQNYVFAGAMHILCVSGLHVGIIFLIFDFLLKFLNKSPKTRLVKSALLILIIWMYASVTGLSPSVQRAGLMVTVFVLSQLTPRRKDNLNTLAFSAMMLLLINPMLLFHTGFQLSYAAVAGILILYQPIYSLFYVKDPILDKVWAITALSFAAQLATFPLAVHYFHVFPPWFWLSNLFTYPLSFLILTVGMAFMLLSWIPWVAFVLGWALGGMVFLLNWLVGLIRFLPYPGLVDLHLPVGEVILIYLLLFVGFGFFVQRNWRLLLPFMAVLVILISHETFDRWRHLHQDGAVVYQLRNQTALRFYNGRHSCMMLDDYLVRHPEKAKFVVEAAQARLGLSETQIIPLHSDSGYGRVNSDTAYSFYYQSGKKWMVISEKSHLQPVTNPIEVDVLVVTRSPKIDTDCLFSLVSPSLIVVDGSVKDGVKDKIRKLAGDRKVSYHDTSEQGALVVSR